MSEETKAKVIENENPSVAEKETKVLKKIGADTGDEAVTKVDLRQPLKEESDAVQEPSTDESVLRGSGTDEKTREETEVELQEVQQEENQLTLEEVIEEETKEEPKKEPQEELKEEEAVPQTEVQNEINIPDNIHDLVQFMNETGGTVEDFVNLNKDYTSYDTDAIIKEYYNKTKPHLDTEEVNFLIEDRFSYDEEIDDPREIKRKQVAYKEQVAEAKEYLEGQKNKYYKEVKINGNLSREQQKAVDFFNRYNTEQQEIARQQTQATDQFKAKTNQVFNQEFKGFDFKINDKKFRYNLKDVENVKNTQMDIMNIVGSYLDDNNKLSDGYGYHKALFAAKNADNIANHFYQLGKTEAIKEISTESKNINMDPRQVNSGTVESGGVKVRAISGDDSSKLRIKLKK
jgi:hypothetical protein